MAAAVFQDLFIGTADGQIISHMVDPDAFSGGKLTYIFGFVGFLYGKKSMGSLCITAFLDTFQGNDYPALEKYGELFLEGTGKAFFCGNADFPPAKHFFVAMLISRRV